VGGFNLQVRVHCSSNSFQTKTALQIQTNKHRHLSTSISPCFYWKPRLTSNKHPLNNKHTTAANLSHAFDRHHHFTLFKLYLSCNGHLSRGHSTSGTCFLLSVVKPTYICFVSDRNITFLLHIQAANTLWMQLVWMYTVNIVLSTVY